MDKQGREYELALKAQGGDREAIAALVELTRMRLFSQAYAVVNHYDDAQDAVAGALLQICLRIGQLREPERVVPWMQSIVRREALHLRRRRETIPLNTDEPDRRPEETAALLRLDIERALQCLPGQYAQALRLFYMDGLSVHEIADALRPVSSGTVKVWLHRGRRQMASEMKGYIPMTRPIDSQDDPRARQIPPHPAAILHTELTPDLLRAVSDALRDAGFTPHPLSPDDLPDLRADQLPLHHALKDYEALVVDETIGGRSGLEYVLFCKAHAETANIPITLLHSQEENALLVTACYAAGVTHLADRKTPESLTAALRKASEPRVGNWASFTERTRHIVLQAQRVAIHFGENKVSTEHLLLALAHEADCVGARILIDLNAPLNTVIAAIERRTGRGPGWDETQDLTLTPRSKNVIDYAVEEAAGLGNGYIGSEHLLLGLIRETEGLAGRVLAELGVTLRQTRDHVARLQAESKR